MKPQPRSLAFTLIEVLVVVAIIGVLFSLLLVALSKSRGSARRAQCAHHLKQLGVALHSYHDAHAVFPPAVIWAPIGEPLGEGYYPIGVIDRVARYGDVEQDTIYHNWVALLLPHLEENPVSESLDPR